MTEAASVALWLAYGEMQMIWLLLLASLALAGLVIGTVSLASLQKEAQ
jgi:hypothetical protein